MSSRMLLSMVVACWFCGRTCAQVRPPKQESHLHHIFGAHRDSDNLAQRFNELKCALVLIRTANGFGTGFFVSRDGDIATASHVLGQRMFTSEDNGRMKTELVLPQTFNVT